MPVWGNAAGLWVLLGVPAVLAVHFLQQRARAVRTSTWFLIEALAPDSARGRTWENLRTSRTLWLQLLAVLLAAWVLGEPRWVRTDSAQTVVIVLDASLAMEASRPAAIAAAERELAAAAGLAARTTWVVMTTDPRAPALHRGGDRAAARAALATWRPESGRHDFGPALRLARTLAGAAGRTLLITDRREQVPPDQRAAGVGQVIDNVGFAGATVARDDDGGATWRAFVKNHATTSQERTWYLAAGDARSAAQTVTLAPGALAEISARFPAGAERVTVVLAEDGFAADDRLPLVVPRAKPLAVAVEGDDGAAQFFGKVARVVDGVTVVSGAAPATLRIARLGAEAVAAEARGGIFWPPADRRAQLPLLNESVTPARDPLVADLNWQGWLGAGPHGFAAVPGDRPLLWHGRWPLVWVREAPGARKLIFGFDWETSNAARLPATVLLVRRFLEAERDAQRAAYRANFDGGSRVAIVGAPTDGAWTLEFAPAHGAAGELPRVTSLAPAERAELRAPGRAGFFTVRRGDEVLVEGAAQPGDVRQGDFRSAETFTVELGDARDAALERHTVADPLVPLWLLLLAAAMLGSWREPRARMEAAAAS